MTEAEQFTIVGRRHVRFVDGKAVRLEVGSVYTPTDAERRAFPDRFKKVEKAPSTAESKVDAEEPAPKPKRPTRAKTTAKATKPKTRRRSTQKKTDGDK